MNPVDHYLRELLFEYDCVTVAGLGGFIAQSRPSRLLRDRRRIYPPSRIIGFNAMLVHDDGNLASCIARREQISYREAVARVEEFTRQCRNALKDRGSVNFEGIGSISLNPEGNLVFQPLPDMNFSASSFGLESIYVHPAQSEGPRERLSEKPADRRVAGAGKTIPGTVRWTVGITIPVILFLLYGIIFPTSMQRLYTNYSGIFSGIPVTVPDQTATPRTLDKPASFPDQPVEMPAVTDTRPTAEKETEPVEPATETARPEPVVENPAASPAPALKKDAVRPVPPAKVDETLAPGQRYFIIGGCFEEANNARKFMNELKRRGFEAEEAGVNQRGHFRISYRSFLNRHDALVYLNEIKGRENPSAWLLKY